MNSYTHAHTKTHSMTQLSKSPLLRGLPVLVYLCVYETESGQVFVACQTDRNSGLTSCVGLGCWDTHKKSFAVKCHFKAFCL